MSTRVSLHMPKRKKHFISHEKHLLPYQTAVQTLVLPLVSSSCFRTVRSYCSATCTLLHLKVDFDALIFKNDLYKGQKFVFVSIPVRDSRWTVVCFMSLFSLELFNFLNAVGCLVSLLFCVCVCVCVCTSCCFVLLWIVMSLFLLKKRLLI